MDIDISAGPTVGREPELGQLEAALDALDGGGPTWLSVAGEPGIGKTRLLAELRRRGEQRGQLVLAGSAAEFEREVPFSVWVDALDAYVASQADDEWEPVLVRELGEMLPSLRRTAAEGGPAIADERYRAHRAVRRLLELFATDRPLLLVLDDLHWADAASVELIASLLRRGPAAPVLVALAFRRGQASQRLAAALAMPGVRRIELAHLTEAQSGELLGGLDKRSLSSIYRRGGGNPFYLQQLARAGSNGSPSGPQAGAQSDDQDAVPLAVAAAIADELGSLSPPTRLFLDAAAIAGEPFEPDLAAAIAELSPADGLAALDDLLECDLVRPTRIPRRFSFRHPLVRRAVYESVRGGWRLSAHARAAAVLADRGTAAADRAHHVEQSATHGDNDAIELFLEAGRSVAPRAPAAAARWFGAALRLLPGEQSERQVEVRLALTSALRALGELEQCRTTMLETIALLAPEDVSRRIALTAQCAAVEHWLGRHEEAHRRLARALEQLDERDTADAATLQIELVVDGLYEMDFELATEMGEAALETACRLDDPALIMAAASALCLAEMATGQTEAAIPHRELALEQLARLSDDELAARLDALYHLSWAENYLERYDEAIAHAERGVELARATGQGRLLMPLMLVKCYPLEMQGRLAEVIELCEEAVEGARLSTNPHYLFWALFELGWAHYYAGDLSAAIAAGEESARVGQRMAGGTMPSAGGGPGWCLAVSALESGDAARASRDHARRRRRGHGGVDPRRAVLQLGERGAGRTGARAPGRGRRLRAPVRGERRRARPATSRRDGGAHARHRAAGSRRPARRRPLRPGVARGRRGDRRPPPDRLLAQSPRPVAGRRRRARRGGRGAAPGRARARRMRFRPDARRGAPRAAQVRRPRRAARAHDTAGRRPGDAQQARARGRRAGHRSPHQPPDRGRAVPQRQDDRVAPAQHLLQARRVLAGGGRAGGGARQARRDRGAERPMTTVAAPAQADADAARLRELGYEQELRRGLRIFDNVALGFAAMSPVVGLYAVVLVGTLVAGPAWIWVLPIALAGQCLLLVVYTELAAEFPIAGGAYQWSRRLLGGSYGWLSGWVAICAYVAANTTVAYLGAPWALTLLGIEATPNAIVVTGMLLVVVCALTGAFGVDVLGRAIKVGIAAEVVAAIGIAFALLLVFREQDVSILTHTLGAEALSGGSVGAGMLAALAVGGWVFIGFDACICASEETRNAARHVPRAIWVAMLGVGALVFLNAVAVTLAHPGPATVVAGADIDPVTTAVVTSFGSWSAKPFAAIVLVAFLACGMSAQALTARAMYSAARDGVLPASPFLRRVDRRQSPVGAIAATTVLACLGLLLGLNSAAVGSLIAFGTAAIYVAFLLIALAALIARVRGTWTPAGPVQLGRAGLVVNVLAVLWLGFESINIAWPRRSLAPPDAPVYQVWAAPIVLAVIATVGLVYLLVAKPHRKLT